MCRGARVSAQLEFARLPLLPCVLALAADGSVTGASKRNWESYASDVSLGPAMGDRERALLTLAALVGGMALARATAAAAPDLSAEFLATLRRELAREPPETAPRT